MQRRDQKMRKANWLVVAAFVMAGNAALAADKSIEAFVDPSSVVGGLNGFTNQEVSTGKSKAGKCKMVIKFGGLAGFAAGDKLICIAGADVRATLGLPPGLVGNSVVVHVVADGFGAAKGKANLTNIGCGTISDAISINGSLVCYKPDLSYNPPAACAGAIPPMLWVPPTTTPTDQLVGLCQGFVAGAGERLPPPTSGVVAQQGLSSPMP
jgi:hypothetical protein